MAVSPRCNKCTDHTSNLTFSAPCVISWTPPRQYIRLHNAENAAKQPHHAEVLHPVQRLHHQILCHWHHCKQHCPAQTQHVSKQLVLPCSSNTPPPSIIPIFQLCEFFRSTLPWPVFSLNSLLSHVRFVWHKSQHLMFMPLSLCSLNIIVKKFASGMLLKKLAVSANKDIKLVMYK